MNKNWIFAILVSFAMLAFGYENIVRNASFEDIDEEGYPVYWEKPGAHWRGSEDAAYEGRRSILFDNDNPENSAWLTQKLKLVSGKTYEYSAIVKCVMKPDAPKGAPEIGCKIILEYSKDGKFTGGNYACSSESLNNEWMRIYGRAVIPENQDAATVGLLPSPRNSIHGKIWIDSVDVHEVEGEVFTCLPVTDCYRDEAAGGVVRVLVGRGSAGFAPVSEEVFRTSTMRLMQNGKVILEVPAETVQDDRLTYKFDATAIPVGEYTMLCRVVDSENGKEYTSENRFRRLDKAPNHRVHIDKHQRMIVDGKPFFPLGMYHKGVTKENLKPYIDSDFNCLIDYNPISGEMLDYLYENNLKVFYANAYASSRTDDKAKTKERHEKGYNTIDSLKSHPAIVAWYINDELAVEYAGDATDYRRGCEEHDPDHPTWTILCDTGNFIKFLPASDIHGSDPYPIPGSDIRTAYTKAVASRKAALDTKMVIQVPQAMCWGRYWKKYGYTEEKTANCPMPTFEEMDAMAWMSIAGGANGLIFYSYFDMLERDVEAPGLPRIPFERAFGDIKKVATRIRNHENVLLSVEEPLRFKVAAVTEKTVEFRPYSLNGVTWLLAVNTSSEKEGSFELDFAKAIEVVGVSLSELTPSVNSGKLSATLKPLQVAFIQVK